MFDVRELRRFLAGHHVSFAWGPSVEASLCEFDAPDAGHTASCHAPSAHGCRPARDHVCAKLARFQETDCRRIRTSDASHFNTLLDLLGATLRLPKSELRLRHSKGTVIHCEVHAARISGHQGQDKVLRVL